MKALILLPLLTATPALADCATGADLSTGIRMIEGDGTTYILTAQSNGVVRQDAFYSDGYVSRNLLGHGVHVLQLADVEDGAMVPDSILNTAYPMAVADMFVPTSSSNWSAETTINAFGYIYAETQSQTWGEAFDMTLGDCTYTALPGKIKYASDGLTIDEGVYYFPDLGVSFLHAYDDNESDPDQFTLLTIEPAE